MASAMAPFSSKTEARGVGVVGLVDGIGGVGGVGGVGVGIGVSPGV